MPAVANDETWKGNHDRLPALQAQNEQFLVERKALEERDVNYGKQKKYDEAELRAWADVKRDHSNNLNNAFYQPDEYDRSQVRFPCPDPTMVLDWTKNFCQDAIAYDNGSFGATEPQHKALAFVKKAMSKRGVFSKPMTPEEVARILSTLRSGYTNGMKATLRKINSKEGVGEHLTEAMTKYCGVKPRACTSEEFKSLCLKNRCAHACANSDKSAGALKRNELMRRQEIEEVGSELAGWARDQVIQQTTLELIRSSKDVAKLRETFKSTAAEKDLESMLTKFAGNDLQLRRFMQAMYKIMA
jgi:hypothetical protein